MFCENYLLESRETLVGHGHVWMYVVHTVSAIAVYNIPPVGICTREHHDQKIDDKIIIYHQKFTINNIQFTF